MSKRSLIAVILLVFLASFMTASGVTKEVWERSPKAEKEDAQKGWLGIYLQDISPDIREALDLKSREGVLVKDVIPDSPADQAGIKQKDVIIEFNGKKVEDAPYFTEIVRETSPGEKVKLTIVRDSKKKTLTITIGKPPEKKLSYEYKFEPPQVKTKMVEPDVSIFRFFSGGRIGVKVQNLTEQLGNYFAVEDGEGALITEVEEDMPAFKAGLKAGDVIVEVDSKKIEDTEDLIDAISKKEEGDKVDIKVIRDRQPRSFAVEVAKREKWTPFGSKELEKFKMSRKTPPSPPGLFWEEEPPSKLQDELQDLKEELQDLKDQLEELRERIR
jgi:S1-C subfamily serine protease